MGEIVHKIRTGYPYWTWGFYILIAFIIYIGIMAGKEEPEGTLVMVFVAFCLILAFPDMRTYIGTDGIMMTFGIGGIWKKRIQRDEITSVTVTRFSGLGHFLGWGIRYGFGKFAGTMMWGMPVVGSRGIWIATKKGAKYLIPDQDPDMTIEYIKNYYPVEMAAGGKNQSAGV
jgi:hypothetical protein